MADEDAPDLFESEDDLPVDETPTEPDGDDSGMRATMAKALAPFRRDLTLGTKGSDVIAVKRAAHKLGGYNLGTPISNEYGPGIKAWMKDWQHTHGIIGGDGSYGEKTHKAFVKRKAFDSYGAYLLKSASWQTPDEKRRAAIVAEALFLVARRDGIAYSQGPTRWSGIDNGILPPEYPRVADCSSLATYVMWVADQTVGGVPDPNGLGWRAGYTGTLRANGHVTTDPKPGALCLYGPGTGRHVTVYIGSDKCVSHGSQSGPLVLPVKYRPDFVEYREYLT